MFTGRRQRSNPAGEPPAKPVGDMFLRPPRRGVWAPEGVRAHGIKKRCESAVYLRNSVAARISAALRFELQGAELFWPNTAVTVATVG